MISLLYTKYNFVTTQEEKTKLTYPLNVDLVKRHCRIDPEFDDDNDYLNSLIKASCQIAENFIEKDIAKTSTEVRIEGFNGSWIRVNDGNFLSLTSITNGDDVSVGTLKQITKSYDFFQIEFEGVVEVDTLKITYLSGFEPENVPPAIQQAILIGVADLYDNKRSDLNWSGLVDNKVFESILSPYKAIRF